jgi:transposase
MIGEDRTEQLDIVPAQLRVKVLCRPRYGCRGCEGAVVFAPLGSHRWRPTLVNSAPAGPL